MTDLKNALVNAGVALHANQRIWLWLKDHPGKTYREVAAAVKCTKAHASGLLSNMTRRGMLTVQVEPVRGRNQTIGRYTVVGDEFVLLPLPKGAPAAPAQPAKATATMPDPAAFDPERFLSKLTLAELRAVHAFTRNLFGK